jgi:hypothetical protein
LSYILDKLHEELKDIYVPNEGEEADEILDNKIVNNWNETGEKN